jgi:N-acetylglucosaminyldiphosphoundecaprenol N-acetyl-beta-D-mannosaminyltransferase
MKCWVKKKSQKRFKKNKKLDLVDDKFNGTQWKIFDIPLFSREKNRVLDIIGKKIESGTNKYWIATVNPEFVMTAQKDNGFKKILQKTDLNVVDGIGLVWARELDARKKNKISKFLLGFKIGVEVLRGKYKDQVASGADLILELTKIAKEKNKKIFLLGGWNGRAKKTTQFLINKFELADNQIVWCEGEPKVENSEVIRRINRFKPDILLVAYGMKKQEFWIDEYLDELDVGIVMGVGRSFDYYSGELKRAPVWVRKMGMEWLYSLIKEPNRLKRQLVLPGFVWKVLVG